MYKERDKSGAVHFLVNHTIATVDIQENAERDKSGAVHFLVNHSIATVDIQENAERDTSDDVHSVVTQIIASVDIQKQFQITLYSSKNLFCRTRTMRRYV